VCNSRDLDQTLLSVRASTALTRYVVTITLSSFVSYESTTTGHLLPSSQQYTCHRRSVEPNPSAKTKMSVGSGQKIGDGLPQRVVVLQRKSPIHSQRVVDQDDCI